MKKFKSVGCSLLCLLTLSQVATPLTVAYATESALVQKQDVSVTEEEFLGDDSVTEVTDIVAISETAVQINYSDGTSDIIERKADGVYKNGVYYMPLEQPSARTGFRSASLNQWYYASAASDSAADVAAANDAAADIVAKLLSLGFPTVGTAWEFVYKLANAIKPAAPGSYHYTTIYVNPATRQMKVITNYYADSELAHNITTRTSFRNF